MPRLGHITLLPDMKGQLAMESAKTLQTESK